MKNLEKDGKRDKQLFLVVVVIQELVTLQFDNYSIQVIEEGSCLCTMVRSLEVIATNHIVSKMFGVEIIKLIIFN
jgi:hypothetical protein